MLCRIGGERIRQERKMISRYRAGDEKDATVGALLSEELNGKANEIVSIASHQTAPLAGGSLQLLPVRPSESADLVRADGIDTPGSHQLSHRRAEVLIQVEPHDRSTANEGC